MPNSQEEYDELYGIYEDLNDENSTLRNELEQANQQIRDLENAITRALALLDRQEYVFGDFISDLKDTLEG